MNNEQQNSNTNSNSQTKTICKLGLDVHAKSIVVACQMGGSNPKRPQRFTPEAFLSWVQELIKRGYQTISCYEAGPTGFWLHRFLTRVGISNYVVCPTTLDSRAKGVNNDHTDALELLSRLDRYLAGNTQAFSVVKVPTEAQEQKRGLARQRQQLCSQRLSLAAQGRMLLLSQGYRQSNYWWKGRNWEPLQQCLPQWLKSRLEIFRSVIESIGEQIKKLSVQVTQGAPARLPMGMGRLTHEIIEGEMKDFGHFKNRRQVGSYPGLTGGVSDSGEQRRDLSITKAGNRRLSTALVECAWRMLCYQPDYWLVKKWSAVLLNRQAHVRGRKRAIVAFARQLLIDIWKWKTGRATPESLGWKMITSAA
jgi:transposase